MRLLLRYDEETLSVQLDGTDHPPGRVVAERGLRTKLGNVGVVVVKWEGRHYYGGQGRPRPYAPAEFEVYEVIREAGGGWLEVESRMRWPVRS